jgi:hypothetical protein
VLWKGSLAIGMRDSSWHGYCVTSALMRDHQNYVFGTARPVLTKDLKTLLSTYVAGSACNPVVLYVCRQTSTMVDKASKGKGISKRERLWCDD